MTHDEAAQPINAVAKYTIDPAFKCYLPFTLLAHPQAPASLPLSLDWPYTPAAAPSYSTEEQTAVHMQRKREAREARGMSAQVSRGRQAGRQDAGDKEDELCVCWGA